MSENIRSIDKLDDTVLRASLKEFGWIEHLPAIKDEHGDTLVGHRRLKIAAEEGIDPVIVTVKFGKGPEADAQRLRLAAASNLGSVKLKKKERQRLAERLYGDGSSGLTMKAISAMLDVSEATISGDLGNSSTAEELKPHPKTVTNPKGAGRRKGSGKRRSDPTKIERVIALVLDGDLTREQGAKEVGLGEHAVQLAIERERGRREAEAEIDPKTLSGTAQQKLAAAMRQQDQRLRAEFEDRVLAEIKRRLDEIVLPHINKTKAHYDMIVRTRRGLMTRPMYNSLLRCLHTDTRKNVSAKELDASFQFVKEHEVLFLAEKEMPTTAYDLPRTAAELMAMREKATQERRAKRAAR